VDGWGSAGAFETPPFVCWQIALFRIRISLVAGIPKAAGPICRAILVTALLLGFATLGMPLSALAFQGQNQPPDVSFSVNGTITEQSAGKLTVDSGQDMLFTVKYDSTTQIQHSDGSPAKTSDLRVGVKILAKGTLTEAGDVIAKTITIESGSKGSAK
jgi:hypothetical protein